MVFDTIAFTEIDILPPLIRDYLAQEAPIKPFYKYAPSIDEIQKVIADKNYSDDSRALLIATLQRQYADVEISASTAQNIALLKEPTTYTITTAHQPLVLGGPAYFIYKIASAIKTCLLLQEKFPTYHFVPIYWMGSEDHDFEEVNHLHLFNKKLEWKKESEGPVGRLLIDDELIALIGQVFELLGNAPAATAIKSMIEASFQRERSLAKAVQRFVNALFGEFGLVILNQDDAQLKQQLKPIILEELTARNSIQLIQSTLETLTQQYKVQATPRDINLFYLTDQHRERIIFDDGVYKINNTDLIFSQSDMLDLANQSPEKFSPNVILRPLYQEIILPNLAFVGGAGELSYWLQLKPIFDHYQINYPMLLMRDSVMVWDEKNKNKFLQQGFHTADIFKDIHELEKMFVAKQTSANSFSLKHTRQQIDAQFQEIAQLIASIDSTLLQTVEAEKQKSLNGIDLIEAKVVKAFKRKYDDDLNLIRSTKEKLFPNHILQERQDSFWMFYLKYGPTLLPQLMQHFNAFEQKLTIVS